MTIQKTLGLKKISEDFFSTPSFYIMHFHYTTYIFALLSSFLFLIQCLHGYILQFFSSVFGDLEKTLCKFIHFRLLNVTLSRHLM